MNMPNHAFDDATDPTPRAARTNLDLAATLVGEGSRLAVTVRNLSATGALIRAPVAIDESGAVCLLRGSLSATGMLAWSDGQNGGIRFDTPIDLAAWAPVTTRGQRDVDRMVAQSRGQVAPLRQPGAPSRPVDDVRADIVTRIAEEIGFAARTLERLGARLAEDPGVIARHGADLQDVDVTAQALGHLARLLASDAPETCIADIGMEDLRRRLERAAPLS